MEDAASGRAGGLLMAKASEIAELLGLECAIGDREIERISAIPGAGPEALVFAMDEAALADALASTAGLILGPMSAGDDDRVLRVKDPRTAFARVYAKWFDERGGRGVHPAAIVEVGAVLGAGCEVGAGSYIASGVQLGADCVIGPRVVIHAGTTLGDRVKVQTGAVLGSDGFGYARTRDGYIGFPQIGTLWIGDDVEIGAGTTIDRGALGETRIGRGTKIDNLCHIAHNCVVGEDVIMAAQVGMAGSCVIEDGAMLGG